MKRKGLEAHVIRFASRSLYRLGHGWDSVLVERQYLLFRFPHRSADRLDHCAKITSR